jgi:hypothetical protein
MPAWLQYLSMCCCKKLWYYQNDYQPSNAAVVLSDTRDQLWTKFTELNGTSGLYNGNISWMTTDLATIGEMQGNRAKGMQAMVYRYDQLNRIKRTYSLADYSPGSGFGPRDTTPAAYDESFTYDPNGNFQLLKRYNEGGVLTDDFGYQYYENTNRLRQVKPLDKDLVISSGAVTSNTTFYRNITVSATAYAAASSTVELVASENVSLDPDFIAQDNADFTARLMNDAEGVFIYDAIGNLIRDHD